MSQAADRPARPVGEGSDPARDRWRETLRAKALGAAPERRERFETSSGIEVRDLYTPADLAGLDEDRDLGRPGEYPFTRGRPADHVPQPLLDHAPVRRLRHRRGDEPPLPLPPRARPDRPLGRLRPADADGLRLRLAGRRGRGGPGRGADQQPGRHGRPARWPAARRGQHLDDDQRDRADPAGPLRGGGRGPGRAARADLGHDPERHPQGVHRPRAPTSSRPDRRCAS